MGNIKYEVAYTPISSSIPHRRVSIDNLEQAIRIAKDYKEDEKYTGVKLIEVTVSEQEIEF